MKSANPSIAQSRPSVNHCACATFIAHFQRERVREHARELAVNDHALSIGARYLYCWLDAEAWPSGLTFKETAKETAARIGAPLKSVRKWIKELERGYIMRCHGPRYRISWLNQLEGK